MAPKVRSWVVSGSLLGLLFSGFLLLSGCDGGGGGGSANGPNVESDEMKAQRKATEDFYAKQKGQHK